MSDGLAVTPGGWQPLPEWQRDVATHALSRRDRWPHALLIIGRKGIGKRMLALEFARALLCEDPDASGDACGMCLGCTYVAQGTHPDLRVGVCRHFNKREAARAACRVVANDVDGINAARSAEQLAKFVLGYGIRKIADV